MARYMTRGMVVMVDDDPRSQAALSAALDYTPKTVAMVCADGDDVPGAHSVVRAGKRGLTIDGAFKEAAEDLIPWVAMRRDFVGAQEALGQMLQATGKRATKEMPGFAVLLAGPAPRPINRILTVVDRADGQPSGLMVLVAIAAAQSTGASLDVLLIGAPGESLTTPKKVDEVLRVTRDKDLYEQAQRRAIDAGIRASWIVVEDVVDKVGLTLEQIAEGDYDLVIEDLGSVKLGGRIGRGGRIRRAIGPDGPGSIARAVLEQTDVPLAIVLDAVRLGVVPPAVVKGGAGAVLALGILASAAPAASATPAERAQLNTSVSQSVDAYDAALHEAAELSSPAEVEAAKSAAVDVSAQTTEAAEEDSTEEAESKEAESEDAESEDAESKEAESEEAKVSDTAPADLSPEDVKPEAAPEVDPDSIDLEEAPSVDEAQQAQEQADESKAELNEAEKDFAKAQEEAVDATEAVQDAAATAEEAAAELATAEQDYQQAAAEAEAVITDATGVSGALPGGAGQEDLDAAEAASAQAIADLETVGVEADQALADYEEAAAEAVTAQADLGEAAVAVTEADAAHQEDAATAEAMEQAVADSRVSPVAEGEYHQSAHYGQEGSHWSKGYHTGDDYAAAEGTTVMAAGSGTVVEAGWDDTYGNRVVIEHENGYFTTYNHMSQIDVEVDEEVGAGEKVGEVGNTGNSFGAHLHFEVTQGGDGWSGGDFVDPDAWLSGEVG